MASKEKFSIYRLNELWFSNGEARNETTIRNHIQQMMHNKWYTSIRLNPSILQGMNISLYYKPRHTENRMRSFIEKLIPAGERDEFEARFSVKNCDSIAFFFDNSYVYCVCSWSWYKAVEQEIDEDFSTNILKKSAESNFKAYENRNVSWQTYAAYQVFRWTYSFNKVESFWKIFKKLIWKLRRWSELRNYFATEKNVGAAFSQFSIKVGGSIDIEEMVSLIKHLDTIYQRDLTPEESDQFVFLDSLKPILNKEKGETIMKYFFEHKIRPYLKGQSQNLDVEFCSSEHFSSFFCWNQYELLRNWEEYHTFDSYEIESILDSVRTSEGDLLNNLESAYTLRKSLSIIVEFDNAGIDRPLKEKIVKCVHGEIVYDEEYYFIIDGKVYKLSEDFRRLLNEEIASFLSSPDKIINTIPFDTTRELVGGYEWAFNEHQGELHNFLCFDRVFAEGNGKLELFDLLYEDDGNLYIIHVKKGFDANVRDVCSQLEISAKTIETDIKENRNDPKCIREIYNNAKNYRGTNNYRRILKDKVNNMTFEEFRNKFLNSRRIYVAALMVNEVISPINLAQHNSNIARHEIINTSIVFKEKHEDNFKIAFITP